MPKELIDIRALSTEDLHSKVETLGEAAYRAKQVDEWIWTRRVLRFEDMTSLPAAFRAKLAKEFQFRPISIDLEQKSIDGTLKVRFRLHDDYKVEGVLIPAKGRVTVCISSQVGSSLNCGFCATGQMGLLRQLTAAEIFDQVWLLQEKALENFDTPLTNIVFMGMGEPLLNFSHVMRAIDKIHLEKGLNIGLKRITVSTSGLVKAIRKLAALKVKFKLALSLHATTDEIRNRLMPVNESNPISEVMKALEEFYIETGSRVTFEYILFSGVNDSDLDARRLAAYAVKLPARVNLISYNPVEGLPFRKPDDGKTNRFMHVLVEKGATVTLRQSRGGDIDAACGQLANK